jgi:glycolate oxidase FAD binding subunit
LRIGSDLVEHEPGDLTCIVEGGMRLSALQERLARHGQMLALDPPGDPTIAEVVDLNLSGPRRHRYGAPRDLVIGMTVALAGGGTSSSGGKVVKNVAGYDIGKLVCGARGAFGRVARVALRLHPRPVAEATLVVDLTDPAEAARAAQAVIRSQLVPSAVDILAFRAPERHPKGTREAGDTRQRLALLFEGSTRAVAAQVEAARALVGGDEDPSVWDEVAARQLAAGGRVPFDRLDAFLAGATDAVVRVSALNAYVPDAPAARPPSPLLERIAAELAR